MAISDRPQPPLRAVRTTAKCPICGKPVDQAAEGQKHRPFCSKRCANIDLGRWLKESYRVPSDDTPTEEDLQAPPPGDSPSYRK